MYRLYPYLINTFEDSNDQLDTFNNLLLSAIINQNTPLKRSEPKKTTGSLDERSTYQCVTKAKRSTTV